MPSASPLLVWRTVRHLKPVQIVNRITRRFRRVRVDTRPAPPFAPAHGTWIACTRDPTLSGEGASGEAVFTFLGETHPLAAGPADWQDASRSRLWCYNLHYFDDLVADHAPARAGRHRALISRWIAENPPMHGTGWEPYPLSLRIVNWIKWSLAGHALPPGATDSLALQVRCLAQQLEYHLLGNHLWANAKALLFAGCRFSDGEGGGGRPEAARWLALGERLMRAQWAEQILPDGGHFERSPMYHAIVLEDVLDLLQLDRRFPGRLAPDLVAAWQDGVRRMLRWLAVMTHPDGEIALFNDAAFGIAPTESALSAYAAASGVLPGAGPESQPPAFAPVEHLADSGFVRLSCGDAVVFFDVGPIGPAYLPGHAHADTLSVECSIAGRRVLVNGGTSTYAPGELRQRQRGTALHNTVVVDDEDSSEVWSSFRVGRRAVPFDVTCGVTAAGQPFAQAGHDGYRRLPGQPVHWRRLVLTAGRLEVVDVVQGGFRQAEALFRFVGSHAPGTAAAPAGLRITFDGAVEAPVPAAWYPRFGVSEAAVLHRAPLARGANAGVAAVTTVLTWNPAAESRPS